MLTLDALTDYAAIVSNIVAEFIAFCCHVECEPHEEIEELAKLVPQANSTLLLNKLKSSPDNFGRVSPDVLLKILTAVVEMQPK